MKFNRYHDPSHSWTKVPRKLLQKLGIEATISACSYQRGNFVYLEEDDDLSKLYHALKSKNIPLEFKDFNTNKESKIRNYQSFVPTPIQQS